MFSTKELFDNKFADFFARNEHMCGLLPHNHKHVYGLKLTSPQCLAFKRRGSSAIIILSFVVPRIFIFELKAAKLRLFFVPHTEQIYKLQVLLRQHF